MEEGERERERKSNKEEGWEGCREDGCSSFHCVCGGWSGERPNNLLK